jgi:hypothetical protein
VAVQNEFKEIADKYRDDDATIEALKKGKLEAFFHAHPGV